MKVLLIYTLQSIKKNFVKSLIIIFTLILSCATLYITLAINYDSLLSANQVITRSADNYDILIYSDGEDPSEYEDLPEIKQSLSFRTDYLEYEDNKYVIYTGNVKEIFSSNMLKITKATDQFFKKNVYQFFTTEENAMLHNLELGDKIQILNKSFVLTAYVEDLKAFDVDISDTTEIFVPNDISDILGYSLSNNTVLLDIEEDHLLNEYVFSLRSSHSSAIVNPLYFEDVSSTFKSLKVIMIGLIVVLLLLSSYVIYSLESLMLNDRLNELITFRTIGATNKSLSLIISLEAILYTIFSSLIGIPLGYFGYNLTRTVNHLNARGFNFGIGLISYTILFLLTIGIVFTTVYKRTHNKTIKELIFPKAEEIKRPRLLQLILAVACVLAALIIYPFNSNLNFAVLILQFILALSGGILLTSPLCYYISKGFANLVMKIKNRTNNEILGSIWLGLKNIERTKTNRKMAISISALLSLILVILFSITSVKDFFNDYANLYPYDILIKNADEMEYDYSFINSIDGVDHYVFDYYDIKHSVVNGKKIKIKHIDNDYVSGGISYLGEKPVLQGNEVIVDELLAKMNDYHIGDILHIEQDYIRNGEVKDIEFDVVVKGFCNSTINYSSRTTMLYSHEFYLEHVEHCPAIVGVYITRNANKEKVMSVLDFEITKQTGADHNVWDSFEYANTDLTRATDNLSILGVLPIFFIFISLVGLIDSEIIAFNQRKKEYAVLSSICMSRKKISIMIITEILMSFLVGGILGFSLGIWLTTIAYNIISVKLIYIQFIIDYKAILIALGLLLLLLLSTSLIPIIKLRKMIISKEVQYE